MGHWLQKRRVRPDRGIPREELEALFPASAKAPETQRFEPQDENDEQDIEFLHRIASQVALEEQRARAERLAAEAGGRPKPRPLPSPPRVVRDDEEVLQVFRESMVEPDRRSELSKRVAPVEIGELLDDLATTAAALRRRKAA